MKKTIILLFIAATSLVSAQVVDGTGEKVFMVRIAKPNRQAISETMLKTGSIESPDIVSVTTKVTGRVKSMELGSGTIVEAGVRVKKGEVITLLEDRDYIATRNVAKAAVRYAEVNVKDKEREYKRTKSLFDEGSATEQEVDLSSAEAERAAANLEQARSNLEVAEINLLETKILAPMDGVISKKSVSPGSLVSAGSEICEVVRVDKVRLMLDVPAMIAPKIVKNQTTVDVTVDAYPGETLPLKVTNIHPVANSATRTIRLEIEIDNSDGKYFPGMYATGKTAVQFRENVLVVPYESVIRTVKNKFVYVVKDGRAIATPVETGIRSDAVVEIVSGISDDDEIVVSGQQRLANNVKVRLDKGE